MAFKRLIAFFLLLIIGRMESRPNLCSASFKPLNSFTTITKLVNDSYLISDHQKRYFLLEGSEFVNFNKGTNYSRVIVDNQTLGSHHFDFDTAFVIDFDGHCINIEEKLFVFKGANNGPLGFEYTHFTNRSWHTVQNTASDNHDLRLLGKVGDVKNYFQLVLYFQSFGLLFFRGKGSILGYCTDNGWKVTRDALSIGGVKEQDVLKIDAGFVDKDEQLVYLFESYSIGSNHQHLRSHYYYCSYKLSTSKVSLSCKQEQLEKLCGPKSDDETEKTFTISLIVLICLVVVIAIVLQAIVCLLCCCSGTAKKNDSLENPQTLVSGNESHAVLPESSSVHQNTIKLNT